MQKKLFKNTLRSLVKNKITLLALTFLVFLSVGVFTLLSSTTSNINNTYNSIAKEGNLHDLTISEQYSIGNSDYTFYKTNTNDAIN
jgi:putative ABC transport system permease protein